MVRLMRRMMEREGGDDRVLTIGAGEGGSGGAKCLGFALVLENSADDLLRCTFSKGQLAAVIPIFEQ